MMEQDNITGARLTNQHLAGVKFKRAMELVEWMGVLQAQDFEMSKWAIGVRLPGITLPEVEAAVDAGDIVRIHLLRPTWHLVSSNDLRWMLDLTSVQIKSSMKSRDNQLGLTTSIISKSNDVITKALLNGKHLTRDELAGELKRERIDTDQNRLSHLFARAELDGLICSGASRDGKHTYALLADRIPNNETLTREESLAKLAWKYFSSHGPASIRDFTWWSGLPVPYARQALEMIKSNLDFVKIQTQTFWFSGDRFDTKLAGESVHFLPTFDEYIIGYADRRAALADQNQRRMITSNGIFRAVIIVNGQVIGIWKRQIKKDKVFVDAEIFGRTDLAVGSQVEKASLEYGKFLEKEVVYNPEASIGPLKS